MDDLVWLSDLDTVVLESLACLLEEFLLSNHRITR